MDVEILPSRDALAARASNLVAQQLARAVAARGRATLAVSGGSTPAAFEVKLAACDLRWEAIHLFQVDERVVRRDDPDRNLTGLQAALLDRVAFPAANAHPMPVEDPDLERAAVAYAQELRDVAGPDGRLDVVHLGLGDDGHTASWPPGDPVIDATADVVLVGSFKGHRRMTLTPPAVNRARWILWMVSGTGKAPMLARLLRGDPTLPASRVRREQAKLLADSDAVTGVRPGG